jgi:hypothetical protein
LRSGRPEAQQREDSLTAEIVRLKFVVAQKDKDIAALAPAPRERDEQRALAQRLARENLELKQRLAETNPATNPSGAESRPSDPEPPRGENMASQPASAPAAR